VTAHPATPTDEPMTMPSCRGPSLGSFCSDMCSKNSSSGLWYLFLFQPCPPRRDDGFCTGPKSVALLLRLPILLCVLPVFRARPPSVFKLFSVLLELAVRPLVLLAGGPGPKLISSVQNGFISNGAGCWYRPGCSICTASLCLRSRRASCRRLRR
jgi:hypothetical protein